MNKITKAEITSAGDDARKLRELALKAGVKFVGVKVDQLKKDLEAAAGDESAAGPAAAPKTVKKEAAKPAAKPAAAAKKPAAKPAAAAKKPAAKAKAPAKKQERKLVSAADQKIIDKLDTKKAKILTLREKGYSIHAMGIAVDMHPTNVSRYIRDAGLSTSTERVPKERRDRIKATIASKKVGTVVAKATPVVKKAAAKKPVAKATAKKVSKKPAKKAAKKATKKSGKK